MGIERVRGGRVSDGRVSDGRDCCCCCCCCVPIGGGRSCLRRCRRSLGVRLFLLVVVGDGDGVPASIAARALSLAAFCCCFVSSVGGLGTTMVALLVVGLQLDFPCPMVSFGRGVVVLFFNY